MKEERKKQARSNKQQGKATQHTQHVHIHVVYIPHLPRLRLGCSVEGESGLDPAIDSAQCEHSLWSAADGQHYQRGIG